MNNFKNFELFIVPNSLKNRLLKNSNLRNIKYITKEELKKKFYFDYNYKAIKYIMKNYNLKYDNAKLYIDNMYFIDDIKDDNLIFKLIKKIKKELIDRQLLIIDNNFKYYLQNTSIKVYGYDILDKFYLKLFDKISKLTDIEIIKNKKVDKTKKLDIYEFNTIEEETLFVCHNIIKLINNNIDINKIYIANYSDEYENIIRKIFNTHNIPINLSNNDSLYNTNIGAYFKDILNTDVKCSRIVEMIDEYYSKNQNLSTNHYNKIINICNKYFDSDYLDSYDIICIKNELKETKINNDKYKNAINLIEYIDNIIDDDMYVFFIGFNQGIVPKIYKNEDFLSDKVKSNNNMSTSLDLNILTKEKFIEKLYKINNLTLSYKLSSEFETFYKSNLIDELGINVINNYKFDNIYSNEYNKFLLCKYLDLLVKYGVHNDELDSLYNTYSNIKYIAYDNTYKKIDTEKLLKYIDNKLLLSYTHLDNYNRCAFKYYLSNILKLNKKEDTFKIKLGNLYHYLLSIAFNENFDFEKEYNKYISDLDLDVKEQFFINNLKQEIIDTIEIIKYQNSFSELNESLYEEKIYINKNINNIDITFMGVIDKVKYKIENNNIYIAIIDYKTGIPKINLDYSKYGINFQLPVYLYLAQNIKKFKDDKINYIGFYLQKICNKTLDASRDEKLQKIEALKLQGYTNSNHDLIRKLDKNFDNSQIIKSMRLSSNGFYKYTKVLDDNQINNLINLVENIIDESINRILDCNFNINPKKINNINVGCEFCTYKDICYKKENDAVKLDEVKYEEFLI